VCEKDKGTIKLVRQAEITQTIRKGPLCGMGKRRAWTKIPESMATIRTTKKANCAEEVKVLSEFVSESA